MRLLLILGATFSAFNGAVAQLSPKKYLTLPLGEVRPLGWLSDQLDVQTNGMAGHLHDFYNYVKNSDWIGGSSAYSSLEEAGSYWFNGMVPHGVLTSNSEIQAQTYQFLDYVLTHQETAGWLGPEAGNNRTRYLWGRYPFFFGAIQMVEYNSSLTDRVVSAMHEFVPLANEMIRKGEGLEIWTNTRWEDFVMTLQWLYEYHPNGNEDLLLDTMLQLKWSGVPWEEVFKAENFPHGPVENLENPTGYVLSWHGVNMAEGMKALPATYRFSHNQSDLNLASSGWDLLFQYHGRPSGIYGADEYLAGMEATRGTELCAVVETMFSGSYLYQMIGDTKFLDRVERITYNALPGTLTGDMWARQYDQQQNQIASKNMTPDPFAVNSGYSNVFGLEPYYPCCTVNHPQGYPKFITNSFLTTADQSSLVQAYLGPLKTSTTLTGNNVVTVTVDTLYPFGDTLSYTVTASRRFTFYVRIPSWVVGGTIATNGGSTKPVSPSNGLFAINIPSGTTKFVLNLPAEITTESRLHGAVALHRGPLHYALDINFNKTVIKANAVEPRAADYELDATSAWAYAIDPSTAKYVYAPPANGVLPSPIFDEGLPPGSITVSACSINWGLAGDTFVSVPPTKPRCIGSVETIVLNPYGSTKLRISEFPVFSS
ncbi:uncharacterized protein EV420DRAFT_753695 [Desarmillaria tabescens]|uniref:DUF1680-domain-containing protein n=1 Tax=Armillaria tabescens TaxID=1929756 RepID=A0AA39JZM8_ARMTA|nr:uncharacterized protein EV420DRAFT_753695 [Desarmillaria tabescens]KAK0450414.1 hypothetical protein EV420DRAFT_753695 [Desarmillaria tabescens]